MSYIISLVLVFFLMFLILTFFRQHKRKGGKNQDWKVNAIVLQYFDSLGQFEDEMTNIERRLRKGKDLPILSCILIFNFLLPDLLQYYADHHLTVRIREVHKGITAAST